jgi:ABC-type polysaccharide/polyol phosphate transport system ATPase subunit
MASIRAENLCLHYPLAVKPRDVAESAQLPENIVCVGSRYYVLALNHLSFHFKQGQRIGLIGRNGSGKSTLLRALGGIYAPTSGVLQTEGQVSSLFNINLGIQPDASGRENIFIRCLLKGWSRREIAERIPEIVEYSDLQDVIDLPLRTYSDGMRMRLLFAIATTASPEILLLDEWIGAGDANFRKKATARMNSLVDKAGITVIASHNRGLLRQVCDLGMWLHNGKMRAFGPIEDIYEMHDEANQKNGRA